MLFIAANPLFLWLLPLAALPVLFHLFLRVRKRRRPFPSLMFFRQADPRLSARRRIREWLVLLLRALAIAFLLLALARPMWTGSGGGAEMAAALLIDNSGSMTAATPAGTSRLSAALAAASAFVGDLDARGRTTLLLTVDDPAVVLPRGPLADRAALRTALDGIRETEATGAPDRALRAACEVLAASPAPLRELHVFTDLQDGEWNRAPAEPLRLPAHTSVTVHRIPAARADLVNVSLSGIALPPRRLLAGRLHEAAVTIFNPGDAEAAVKLDTEDSDAAVQTFSLTVPPRESRVLGVAIRPDAPGFHWLAARIEQDGFAADNTAYAGYVCIGPQPVLFHGAAADYGLLPAALSPAGAGQLSGLAPVFAGPDTFTPRLAADRPVLAALAWSSLAALDPEALRTYVRAGGALCIVSSQEVAATATGIPPWVGASPGPLRTSTEGRNLVLYNTDHPLWDDLRTPEGRILLGGLKTFRFRPLALADDAVPLIGLEDGEVLLACRTEGAGRVYACGLAFTSAHSTLPLKPGFLALVQTMAMFSTNAPSTVLTLTAGQRPVMPRSDTAVRIRGTIGNAVDWEGEDSALPAFARSGIYTLQAGADTRFVAVGAAAAEGVPRYVKGAAVPALDGIRHEVRTLRDIPSCLAQIRRARSGIDGFLPLLGLALLAVLAEGWLANPAPVRPLAARTVDRPPSPGTMTA